jgi:hypothetical protein
MVAAGFEALSRFTGMVARASATPNSAVRRKRKPT